MFEVEDVPQTDTANEPLELQLTLTLDGDNATVTDVQKAPAKKTRKRKVQQHNIGEDAIRVAKPKSRPRKDNSLRTLFRQLLAELRIDELKKPWMATKSFQLLDTEEKLAAWVDALLADKSRWVAPYKGHAPVPCVAVDTETIGLDTRVLVHIEEARNEDGSYQRGADGEILWTAVYEVKIEVAGVCLSADGVSGVYIPIFHEKGNNVPRNVVAYHLQRLFDVAHLIFYNAKFDREVMRLTLGTRFRDYPHFEDVQSLQYQNDPKAQIKDDSFAGDAGGLKKLAKDKLDIDMIELDSIGKVSALWCPVSESSECVCTEETRKLVKHGTRMQFVPFTWIPTEVALWYAAADAICTWLLWFQLKDEAQSRPRVHRIDGELVDSITWMERQRFLIAEDPHRRMKESHLRSMIERREQLRQIALRHGWTELHTDEGVLIEDSKFNPDKKHLGQLLYGIMKLQVVRKSEKTGEPSSDKQAIADLRKLYPDNDFLKALEEYRKYVALHPENLRFDPHDKTARVYLKQNVVAGGRLAATGGKFERDGGFGLNVQAIKKVGGNWFVKGKVLVPDLIQSDEVEEHEESELHPSCFKEVEENQIVGWSQVVGFKGEGDDREPIFEVFDSQFPEDIDTEVVVTDEYGDELRLQKYHGEAPERFRKPVYEKRKVQKKAPGIIKNHIANYLGYAICLVPGCTSCAEKHGILINEGKLDANQVLNLRALFIAPPGWTFLSSDYSNIEMRVAANESGEPEFIFEFLEGSGDFHTLTAIKVFPEYNDPKTTKETRKELRALAKIINFALLYGGTRYTIFENMKRLKPDITMKDCERMVDAYWAGVPVFKAFCDHKQQIARDHMVVHTGTGRVVKFDSAMKELKIHVPTDEEWQQYFAYLRIRKQQRKAAEEGFEAEAASLQEVMDRAWKDKSTGVRNASEYNRFISKIQRIAVNVPLQGLAGDIMRMAMNRIRKWATILEPMVQAVLRMHGSVHDELDYTVKNEYLPFVVPRVTRLMKLRKLHELRGWKVGIESDTEYGPSWDVQFHLTGDADHLPAGWTGVAGMEEYLPGEFDLDTVAALVRAIASGKEDAREKVVAWAKENLHPRANEAFKTAVWTKNSKKEDVPQVDPKAIRRQVFAALQLHEYWVIDETPDDAPLSVFETLEQFEARCGLTPKDRGFMPDGGFLAAIDLKNARRPIVPFLGDTPEVGSAPRPEPTVPAPSTTPAASKSSADLFPTTTTPEVDPTTVGDDLLAELLGPPTPRPRQPAPAAKSEPLPEQYGTASSSKLMAKRSRKTSEPVVSEVVANLPKLNVSSKAEMNAFLDAVGFGLGSNSIRCLWNGKEKIISGTTANEVPEMFRMKEYEEAYA